MIISILRRTYDPELKCISDMERGGGAAAPGRPTRWAKELQLQRIRHEAQQKDKQRQERAKSAVGVQRRRIVNRRGAEVTHAK